MKKDEKIKQIALEYFGIPLTPQAPEIASGNLGQPSPNFHTLGVNSIKAALESAYTAGYNKAQSNARKKGKIIPGTLGYD